MKRKTGLKRVASFLLMLIMVLSLSITALADETNKSDETTTVDSMTETTTMDSVTETTTMDSMTETTTEDSVTETTTEENGEEPAVPCTATQGCTLAEGHEGDCAVPKRIAKAAVETCDHSRMRPWTIDGDECVRKCWNCTFEERHPSQWSDYVEVDPKAGHYCTGRYCATCNQANRIDTVEELQAVIEKGYTTLNIDSWEKSAWDYYEAKNNPITISEDVTIDGKDAVIERLGYGYGDGKEPTFIVENGATLTLKNLTIHGGGVDMYGSCMILVENGNLILDEGAVLTNGYTYGSCSGIHVKNGTLVMNEGSAIKDNLTSKVVLLEKGVFTMNGGEISGNKNEGELISIGIDEKGNPEDAAFIMQGGTISGNSEHQGKEFGAPVILAQGGTITIDEGKITGNQYGGVMVYGGSLTMNGGEISGNTTGYIGAGIMGAEALGSLGGDGEVESVITITGGVIKGNKNSLDMDSDTLLGFNENVSVKGGEIGCFGGNEETLKVLYAVVNNGALPDDLTEDELLKFAQDELVLTEEQLAMEPKITGGSFGNDVTKYLAPVEGITIIKDGDKYVVHTHVLVKTDAKVSTCTEAGNEAYWSCDGCKKLFSDENGTNEILKPVAVPPTGHKLTAVAEKPATHVEAGHKAYWECERCQEMFADAEGKQLITEPEKIPVQGHSFGKAWVSDEKNHWHECDCGEKAEQAAHSYKWVVDKEATETEAGSKHEECEVCGYKKATVEIPATGTPVQPPEPNPTKPGTSNTGNETNPTKPGASNTGNETNPAKPNVPNTGDETNLTMLFAVMAVSMLGVGVMAVLLAKKRYTDKYQK